MTLLKSSQTSDVATLVWMLSELLYCVVIHLSLKAHLLPLTRDDIPNWRVFSARHEELQLNKTSNASRAVNTNRARAPLIAVSAFIRDVGRTFHF